MSMGSSCDEEGNPLDGLVLANILFGKMEVMVDGKEKVELDCMFSKAGGNETEWTGEVFIGGASDLAVFNQGTQAPATNSAKVKSVEEATTIAFMYGYWGNETPLTVGTYTSSGEMLSITSTYGSANENAVMTLEIVELNSTGIKGEFEGELSTKTGNISLKGVFWAAKADE